MTGPMLLEGRQLEEKRFDSEFYSELRSESRYASVTTLEQVDFEGRPCYKVRLVRKTGGEDIEFYDVATGLKAGSITTRETQMGTVTGTTVESDYRKFGNLLQPTKVVSHIGGLEQVITISSIEYDRVAAFGLRSAAGHQGPVEVTAASCGGRGRVLAALSLALALTAASGLEARCAGAAGRRDVRRRVADHPRLSLRQDAERRRLGRGVEGAAAEGRGRAHAGRAARGDPRHARAARPVAFRAPARRAPTAPRTRRRISAARPGSTSGCSAATSSSPKSTRTAAAAAAGVRTGWKVQAIDGSARRDAARRPAGVARAAPAATSRPGGSRTRVCAARRVRAPRSPSKTAPARRRVSRSNAASRTGSRSPSATCRRCSCACGRSARTTPAGRTAGVIGFNVWMAAVDPLFQQAVDEFRSSDGIVIDLRGNPGGLAAMLMGISGHFIDERKALGVMKTRDNELRFVVNPRRVNAPRRAGAAVCRPGGDSRRRAERQRLGVFCRRHAVARAGARFRTADAWARRCRRCSLGCRTATC